MRNKMLTAVAITLSMSALLLHTTVFASSITDNTAPTLTAKLSGETVLIEANDEVSGVESVYIDGHKKAYPEKGTLEAALWDYAGTDQYVSVYAVDAAGNQSGTVRVENPYYNTGTVKETTESAVPTQTNAFTPDGTGTTVDNATDSDGKEFFTITTPDENVFYLVIDRQREDKNVYFLNAVTEDDLRSLAKTDEAGSKGSAVPTKEPDPQTSVTPEPGSESESQPENSSDNTMIFVVIAVIAAGGVGYYFKIYKPKHQAVDSDEEDYEEDETGYEEEDEIPKVLTSGEEDFLAEEGEFGGYPEDEPEEDKE